MISAENQKLIRAIELWFIDKQLIEVVTANVRTRDSSLRIPAYKTIKKLIMHHIVQMHCYKIQLYTIYIQYYIEYNNFVNAKESLSEE